MEERFQVGVLTAPHGVRGEIKVYPTTDDPRRFKRLKEVILDTGREERILEIESVKFFKQMVIVKFKGFDTPEEIAKYRQSSIFVTRENAVRLGRDEYFIADLMGLTILNEDNDQIGVLREVLETGANDVYVIDMTDGRELLLPAIKECILDVDVEGGQMKVHILDGLLDEE